jgi:hypothetical protein
LIIGGETIGGKLWEGLSDGSEGRLDGVQPLVSSRFAHSLIVKLNNPHTCMPPGGSGKNEQPPHAYFISSFEVSRGQSMYRPFTHLDALES